MSSRRDSDRLAKIFTLSKRIQQTTEKQYAQVKKVVEKDTELIHAAKELREKRLTTISSANYRYILDQIAIIFGLETDEVITGIIDHDIYVKSFLKIFDSNETLGIFFAYEIFKGYPLESGRFSQKTRNTDIKRCICFDTKTPTKFNTFACAYKRNIKQEIDGNNQVDEIGFIDMTNENSTSLFVTYNFFVNCAVPAIKANINYDTYVQFLNSSNDIVYNTLEFEVDQNLYKGHLLVPHEINETSKKVRLVRKVEKFFGEWMQLIEIVQVKGHELERDTPESGPMQLYEYWRKMLNRYTFIVEFISTKLFISHHQCLIQSQSSKLLKKWNQLDNSLTVLLNEARDNVHYIKTLQKFWEPLYRNNLHEINKCLSGLLMAIRNVSKTSFYFNKCSNITSLFVKITNQLTIACNKFLTNDSKNNIWDMPADKLTKNIDLCEQLLQYYEKLFYETANDMKFNEEKPWEVSPTYIFTYLEKLLKRLKKIRAVIQTELQFKYLERIKIAGTESFADQIKSLRTKIIMENEDVLNYRDNHFDKDFEIFIKNVDHVEDKLREFLKITIQPIQNVESKLLILKRFKRLHLDSLCLDRRYLEISVELEKEIMILKDIYNEDRKNPPIPRNSPPIMGRIMWIRMLIKKIVKLMDAINQRPCVINHAKCQRTIHFYNYMMTLLYHYEITHRKTFYDFSQEVQNLIHVPVLTKKKIQAIYNVNLHNKVFELARETECAWKLKLDVPKVAFVITFCKEKIFGPHYRLLSLIKKYTNFRNSISSTFINIMRFQLKESEIAFKPGLFDITWTSEKLEDFICTAEEVYKRISNFYENVISIQNVRILKELNYISRENLVYIPDEPISAKMYLFESNKLRQKVEREIEKKSILIERAVIDINNMFVDLLDVPPFDYKGRRVFALPLDQITAMNWKIEGEMPVNKYDWIQFDKINRPVFFPTEENRLTMCSKSFETIRYEYATLRNDCMDIFAYNNSKMITALVQCSKKSLELIKNSILKFDWKQDTKLLRPIFFSEMDIKEESGCFIMPDIRVMQEYFKQAVANCIEVHYFVTTWGKQAKNYERKMRKVTPDENRHEKNYYKSVEEHKDVRRATHNVDNGILMFQSDIDELLTNVFEKHKFLWDTKRDEIIFNFVEEDPLLVTIRDKFVEYERISEEIRNSNTADYIGPIEIRKDKVIKFCWEQSKKWKKILGKFLSSKYKRKLENMIEFIKEVDIILVKDIKDLDDVRLVMRYLERVEDVYLQMEFELNLIVDVYDLFTQFQINIGQDDYDKVDSLRIRYNLMLEHTKSVSSRVAEMSSILQVELETGIATFAAELNQFNEDYENKGPMIPGLTAKEASDRTFSFQARFDDLYRKFEMYASGEKLFGLPESSYPVLEIKKREFNYLTKLYSLYLSVLKTIDDYYEMRWTAVDIEAMTTELADFQLRCRKLPRAMQSWPAYIDLKKKVDDFTETCPLLERMTDKAMKPRHWKHLNNILKTNFNIEDPKLTLGRIMDAPILANSEDVEDICIAAIKELDIEAKLKQVIANWTNVNLQFAPFKQRGDLALKGAETMDIITAIEDDLMAMNSLATNRYNAPFKKEILLWVSKLVKTSETLEKWLTVQSLWMYLEAVFVGGDISRQLPMEAKRFGNIDKAYVRIMLRARETSNVIEYCTTDEALENILSYLLEQLESCQKSLTGYLETKRLVFPRFFFVSDPVLLEILGQASNPKTIQSHLLSLFDAMAYVDFQEKSNNIIIAMNSANHEKVLFENPVHCTGNVEIWIGKLLKEMQNTMKSLLAGVALQLNIADFNFVQEFQGWCGQAGLLGVNLLWTKDAEIALRKTKIDKTIMKRTNMKFLNLLNALIDLTVKDLSKLDRIKFETMVTIHVHQRDIFDDLVRMKIKLVTDFEWQKQARYYYYENNDDVIVGISDVNFIYQNEYLGVVERLAITPLTDRCYISLAQAMGMCMGGAPAGPAGTGKTETTKDMGKALGKYVVVFNCSDQMDFRGLGRIYKGIAQSGSWGCFDEFNRIELPVLSVAAQQINIVLTAKKEKKTTFLFSDGDLVSLNPEFGLIITMNPGYAGRQELPENLKIQFRTVAMMVPDRQIIMRVKLASCGFRNNVILARKFYTLYKLCEEQLSKQVHYDFGLRNILSVLRTLGAQKRANQKDTEETIVMRVLRDMNVSKLIDEDEGLFLSLIDDMFPGIKLTTAVYKDLQKAISANVKLLNYVNSPSWNLKVIQLYETSLVRHGLMMMGPTGSGKTSCTNVLLKSFTEMGKLHKEMRMNPKAITAPQMFGRLDAATNDWTDGIFSTLWRRTHKIKTSENCWLVLDGPVDAVWIENLNSVLDDNKTLTLANGDRIKMAENSKLLFEPDNVDNASPATVSRMGMVFLSSSVLSWDVYAQAWINNRDDKAPIFQKYFDSLYNDTLSFVQKKLISKMKILDAVYIRQTLAILDGLLLEQNNNTEKFFERIFLFAVMWSLGAALELNERQKLESYFNKHPSRLRWPKLSPDTSIFEYYVDEQGNWQHWTKKIEDYKYPQDSIPEFASILVPNVDNIRTAFLIETIAKQEKEVLLIGEQGTAKTVMIKGFMNKYDPDSHLIKSFNFSSETSPNMYQRIIESYIEKRVGLSYGPPGQRKMTVFIDDINMPMVNDWGDQITNEIVRQMIEQGGFYSLERPGDFINVLDILIVAAMIHPGGGRNDIPNRLKRQFCIFNCTLPSNNSMDQIFRKIGEGYFSETRFNKVIVKVIPLLIPLTRILWQNVKMKMLPTPANFHYVFNLRDLSRIWQGMLLIKGNECTEVDDLLKLWRHECYRVMADRFTSIEDFQWFEKQIERDAKANLGDLFEYFDNTETYFVDFLRDPPEAVDEEEEVCLEAPKIYEEIPGYEEVENRVKMFMNQFNENIRGFSLDLVFFHDCLKHLMIVSRIIRMPRGNALLVGVGGSGKQSITRLASFIAGYKFFQITLTRAYNATNLCEDLKSLYRIAGVLGQGITFIFTDNEIKDEGFLEYINNILSSGEIANLFSKDELDGITNELTLPMKKEFPKRPPTADNLYEYFISRSRFNLHIALCFSPIGDKLRARTLKFPGLVSGCTIDWFQKWPEDARIAVSNDYLKDFQLVCTDEVKFQVINEMSFIHESVTQACVKYFDRFRRSTFVTPKSLISFLKSYREMYDEGKSDIEMQSTRMSSGLYKLDEAAISVESLKIDLIEMNKIIELATLDTNKVLEEVTKSSEAAEIVKAEVSQKKKSAEELVTIISADKAIAEEKLEVAKPALEEAQSALNTIKAADIATVRKLGKPPYLITLIMDCVCILFRKPLDRVKPDKEKKFLIPSWKSSLKVMSDTRFLPKIVEYATDTINAEMIDLLIPYFSYSLYTFEAAKIACGNVAGLLKWTIAMKDYYGVNKDVLPLKANLAIQEAKYNKAMFDLHEAEEELKAKEKELHEVQCLLDAAIKKKNDVMAEASFVQNKMNAATALIEGLGGEKIRWTEQIATFSSKKDRLVGDVLYLTAFLSYAGPFNQQYRAELQQEWLNDLILRKIPMSSNVGIIESLTDQAQISEWTLQGLPNDDLSVQNGIIATKSARFPLLIDPQSQGKIWIKNREEKNNLIVTSLNNKYFRNHIEDAVSLGIPLLIEDINEDLDPCLDNVLDRNLIKVGTQYKIKIGDKEVDYNKDMRIYMTTTLSNPLFTPEMFARASIVDFTVTLKGLEDQLLGRVILIERKELEDERISLVETVTDNMKKIKQLEIDLLHKLSTTEGSLLDDVTVIEVLNKSKTTAVEVKEKLEVAKVTEVKINNIREEYRPVATRGSLLYFLICQMSMVNCMYQTSLGQFLERFDWSLHNAKKTHVLLERINRILRKLTYEIYRYKSRSLYEQDKPLYVLLMALIIDQNSGVVKYDEFQNFIKGGAALNLNDCPRKPHKWITDEMWLNLVQLSNLRQFQNILIQVENNERNWRIWFQKENPEDEAIPDGYSNIDPFKKLLLIRAFCQDRTLSQARKYIAHSLGPSFAAPIILNYDELYVESRAFTPIICFLSMGSDPSNNIELLAKKNEIKCYAISMGQGQEIHARKLFENCFQEGGWLLLQNCHLGLAYMNELSNLIVECENRKLDPIDTFRIWITTEVHSKFPISMLQISLKFTNEPPSGIRAGLKRTYTNLSQDFLDANESLFYHPLVFAISFLHSVVQERRKFGPLGWNIPYEFNSADWLASCLFIQNHLEDIDPKKGVSWSTVRYMLGEVQYGGRVTDDYDKFLLNTFSKVWFSDKLFDETFCFYKGYNILVFKTQEEYLEAIESMNLSDPPQAYGLHSNANITYQTNYSKAILNAIVSIQPRDLSSGTEETREEKVARLTLDMLNKSPAPFDLNEVKERLKLMGALNSLNIFLKQEIDRMQKVIVLVKKMLKDILLALEGTIIMSEQLQDAVDNIFNARVPISWRKVSWASSTLGFWFTEVINRYTQFYNWAFVGRPITFWMSGFFNPQGFLTAMKQEVARAHKGWALDQIAMMNEVTKLFEEEYKKPPKEGVYIHGMYLDGAGWDIRSAKLVEQTNKVLYVLMPVVWVYATDNLAAAIDPKAYRCPVYKKLSRTDLNYIAPLLLLTNKEPEHWTLRGVALLCDTK
ncbi:dynein axonemal heavy chain 8 [Condylostylus longicornis]|uniref:dynein axonemal heavy chain 8 n=1 Tax=Condylostylus longicornis TaxID=2530218 RepID=UPI00244DEC02|nr:dynein axonemal heavy chain 8 [Condylostylus longicornis]